MRWAKKMTRARIAIRFVLLAMNSMSIDRYAARLRRFFCFPGFEESRLLT